MKRVHISNKDFEAVCEGIDHLLAAWESSDGISEGANSVRRTIDGLKKLKNKISKSKHT